MSSLHSNLLQLAPGAVNALRKQYNLDGPGRMEEAVNILQEWIKQQPHILKKDFSSNYLESSIILSKGSLEKAKNCIDRRCTFKTLLPDYFGVYNIDECLDNLNIYMDYVLLPKQTADYYRVYICKVRSNSLTKDIIFQYYKASLTMADYVVNLDYMNGLIVIYDYSEINMLDIIAAHNLIYLKNFTQILLESYAARMKGMYIITKSSAVDTFVSLIKPFFGKKIADRIHVLSSPEDLSKVFSPDILPKEYGGSEGPIHDISEKWIEVLKSEEAKEVMKDMDKAATDESLRDNDTQFSQEYAGIAGTFRYLRVD